MWPKYYRDYPVDGEQVHEKVEPQKGIIGCEMHERHGWGLEQHRYRKRHRGLMKIIAWFLGVKKSDE